mgnify:CR=1 FL=1
MTAAPPVDTGQAAEGRTAAAATVPQVILRGVEAYEASFAAMRAFTDARTPDTPDQLWLVEHPPVYTLGLGADRGHVLDAQGIPLVQTDRGGEVTYHGPGQVVIYLLFDLRRGERTCKTARFGWLACSWCF